MTVAQNSRRLGPLAVLVMLGTLVSAGGSTEGFDHDYATYAAVLRAHVVRDRAPDRAPRVQGGAHPLRRQLRVDRLPAAGGGTLPRGNARGSLGPAPAAAAARTGTPRLRYLDYDWSLNDTPR